MHTVPWREHDPGPSRCPSWFIVIALVCSVSLGSVFTIKPLGTHYHSTTPVHSWIASLADFLATLTPSRSASNNLRSSGRSGLEGVFRIVRIATMPIITLSLRLSDRCFTVLSETLFSEGNAHISLCIPTASCPGWQDTLLMVRV
jgi:hypothetical protein